MLKRPCEGIDIPSSLVGVYGRMTGFCISGPLYLVISAEATGKPETSFSSGRAKRNFLVLWLISSMFSNFKLMKPWSPPVKALLDVPVNLGMVLSSFLGAGEPVEEVALLLT